MIPVFQKPGDGQCINACLATLTGVSLAEAPQVYCCEVDDLAPYLRRIRRFLRQYGYTIMGFTGKPENYAGATYIAVGDSPRGDESSHAVIMRGKKMVHDPHPSGDGILNHWFFWVIVPLFDRLEP